ncbi:methyltransferase domain-containing protein [Saccharopolyspora rhizosphaerae]|uniref:Methyltransferase domain-containing protein n=1 Tax=Saccharopolyspora rhizosphaerae TaxID=2492662 RepID=A0A426JRN6_9PSEU|nr:methyltransferase domain-containing protein [Saccharopolyspora rhizosphaerae]
MGEQTRARPAGEGPQDSPVGASSLHVLRFLAAALRAKAVVEIGTGSGETARWLLRGMLPDGVLTSIDADPANQRVARDALGEEGVAPARTRMITGCAVEVLPRLTEGGYDLVSVGVASSDYPAYLELGVRLLRPGGVIVFAGVQLGGQEDNRGALATAIRSMVKRVQEDEELVPVTLPTGPGLLAAAKR